MKEIKIIIGKNIKRKREQAGLTQKELSEYMEVSQNTIQSWESGRTEPRMGAVEKMASIFKCTKEDIIGMNVDFAINEDDLVFIMEFNQLTTDKKKLLMDYIELLKRS